MWLVLGGLQGPLRHCYAGLKVLHALSTVPVLSFWRLRQDPPFRIPEGGVIGKAAKYYYGLPIPAKVPTSSDTLTPAWRFPPETGMDGYPPLA